jgi:hypothetical protein
MQCRKAWFAKVSAQNSFTIAARAGQMSILQARMVAQSLYSSWKQLFGRRTLAIIGLAIAVVLSAFGHKLSHYDRHAASSLRIQVAKLWNDPRNALVATNVGLSAKVSHLPGSSAFAIPIQRFPRLGPVIACNLSVCGYSATYFDFLIPFRSPPSNPFCLA